MFLNPSDTISVALEYYNQPSINRSPVASRRPSIGMGQRILGNGELVLGTVYNILPELGGGINYLGTLLFTWGDTDAAAAVRQGTVDSLSYEFRSDGAKDSAAYLGEKLAPIGQGYTNYVQGWADSVYETTGSPLLAALTRVAPDAALEFGGAGAVGRGVKKLVPNIKPGKISGDPGTVSRKFRQALDSTNPQQLSTQAELRVAKLLKQEGNNVFVIDDLLRAPNKGPGFTNDLTVNGNVQVDVKRVGGLGRNAAGDLAKGVRQVGPGGQVIVVRGSESKASLSQIQDFVNNFKPKQPVTFRVLDEANLPKLKGM